MTSLTGSGSGYTILQDDREWNTEAGYSERIRGMRDRLDGAPVEITRLSEGDYTVIGPGLTPLKTQPGYRGKTEHIPNFAVERKLAYELIKCVTDPPEYRRLMDEMIRAEKRRATIQIVSEGGSYEALAEGDYYYKAANFTENRKELGIMLRREEIAARIMELVTVYKLPPIIWAPGGNHYLTGIMIGDALDRLAREQMARQRRNAEKRIEHNRL